MLFMREVNFRRWMYAILIASALFRFGFLIFGDTLPVMWDARRYVAAGIGLISYVDKSADRPVKNDREDRFRFQYYNDKYIQGEQIVWLSYNTRTLTEARDDIFTSGPLYPLFLAIIIYLAPLADFTFARIFGVVLDLISNLLIILIAVRLAGRGPALIAGFIYALYFPFVLASTMLLLETSTSFWLLLGIYLLLRGFEIDGRKHYLTAGIIAALLILNKPTAMLLGIPLVIGFYFYAKKKLNLALLVNRLLFFVTPVIIVFAGWSTATSLKFGQLSLSNPSYREAILRQSSSIVFEGYDLDKVEKDFWTYSIREHILGDPLGYTGLSVKKFERLWSRPYNDFKKSFIIPYKINEILHRFIVVVGLLGLLLLVGKNFPNAAWLLFVIGYYTAIHVVFHSLSRYSFNALPMVIIAAGYFIFEAMALYRNGKTPLRKRLILSAMLILLVWLFDYRWINQVLDADLSYMLVVVTLVVMYALVTGALFIISRSFFTSEGLIKKLLMPATAVVIFIMVGWSTVLSRDEWSEFSCRLNGPDVKAGTRFYISNLQKVKEGELLAAVIDVNSGKGRQNSFTVTVGDTKKEFVGGKPPLLRLFYPKPTYRYYSRFEPIGIEEFRQYAIIIVDDSLVQDDLMRKGYIDITVAINERFEEKNNFINVYGNFFTDDTVHYIPGVRFTSIERYVHKNDPRIRYPVKFLSDSTISYYIKRTGDNITSGTDLSPSPGTQAGRYNIFLMHFMPDGSFLVY